MDIVVCIKQVPGTTDVKINQETNTLIREGVEAMINPFDMYAIEEGVRLRERFGGSLTVITMGPPQAEAALREALSLGCDEAVLLSDRSFAGSDTLATAFTLASGIRRKGNFDIIICGKQATDGDTAQVGPGIAEELDVPHVSFIRKIENISDGTIRLERLIEEGYEIIEMPLPCLITVVKEINEPRLPSLKGMMRAKKVAIETLNKDKLKVPENRLGLKGSPTQVVKIFTPAVREGGEMILGKPDEQVDQLVGKLRDAKII